MVLSIWFMCIFSRQPGRRFSALRSKLGPGAALRSNNGISAGCGVERVRSTLGRGAFFLTCKMQANWGECRPMEDNADFADLDGEESTGDHVADTLARAYREEEMLRMLREDKRRGMRTKEMMAKYGLPWHYIRPMLEQLASPAEKAARKARIADIAAENAEAVMEKIADSVGLMDYDKLPGAAKTLMELSLTLEGKPSQVIEHRHTVVEHDGRADEVARIRESYLEAELVPIADAEHQGSRLQAAKEVSTSIDDY